jgi:hypothetical protein
MLVLQFGRLRLGKLWRLRQDTKQALSVLGGRRGFDSGTGDGGSEETRPERSRRLDRKETGLQAQKADFGWAKVGETARLLQSGPSDWLDKGRGIPIHVSCFGRFFSPRSGV